MRASEAGPWASLSFAASREDESDKPITQAHITSLAVLRTHRKMGIATRLMNATRACALCARGPSGPTLPLRRRPSHDRQFSCILRDIARAEEQFHGLPPVQGRSQVQVRRKGAVCRGAGRPVGWLAGMAASPLTRPASVLDEEEGYYADGENAYYMRKDFGTKADAAEAGLDGVAASDAEGAAAGTVAAADAAPGGVDVFVEPTKDGVAAAVAEAAEEAKE